MNRKGISLFELMITIGLISLVLTLAIPGFQAFFTRIEDICNIRTVTLSFSCARYDAIKNNRSVRIIDENDRFILQEKRNGDWRGFKNFSLKRKGIMEMRGIPVFHPNGMVSPLCTVELKSESHLYKVTLSINGRIKVSRLSLYK